MLLFYEICAIFGGTLLIGQFILTLAGLGGDHEFSDGGGDTIDGELGGGDFDHAGEGHLAGHSSTIGLFKVLTFRALTAAITFFGLAALAMNSAGGKPLETLFVGVAVGIAAMFAVHWLMRQITRLKADGTVNITDAVGEQAQVYLRIPGSQSGAGKVLVALRQGTLELAAWTRGLEIPTGSTVQITHLVGTDAVEVIPVSPSSVEQPHA